MKTFKTPKGTILPMLDMKGKDYLQVAYRLVWFREEKPLWGIETEAVLADEKKSICRATIRDESGRIIAQATKQEDMVGFKDHLEKAETGAIGRALALIGYGTQFAPDLDEAERIVDSPVGRPSVRLAESFPAFEASPPKLVQHAPGDPKGFVVPFGNNKGMTFEKAGRPALAQDRAYWIAKLRADNKEPGDRLKQYLDEINEYLK